MCHCDGVMHDKYDIADPNTLPQRDETHTVRYDVVCWSHSRSYVSRRHQGPPGVVAGDIERACVQPQPTPRHRIAVPTTIVWIGCSGIIIVTATIASVLPAMGSIGSVAGSMGS